MLAILQELASYIEVPDVHVAEQRLGCTSCLDELFWGMFHFG